MFLAGRGATSWASATTIGNITNTSQGSSLSIYMDGVSSGVISSKGGTINIDGQCIISEVNSQNTDAGGSAANIIISGDISVGSVNANGTQGTSGDAENIGGQGGNGGFITVKNGVIADGISAARGAGGTDSGAGSGPNGDIGSITALFSTIPTTATGPEDYPVPSIVACIVNGAFQAS